MNKSKTTKVFLIGFNGKMGKTLRECANQFDIKIIGGLDTKGIHIDIHTAKKLNDIDIKTVFYKNHISYGITTLEYILKNVTFDIIVDFSNPSTVDTVVDIANKVKKPLIVASTGHKNKDIKKIKNLSQKLPILIAPNTSLGITLLLDIAKKTQLVLQSSDVSIIEKHHNQKVDCPSGTAKLIKKCISNNNNTAKIHSIRGGNCVGTHEVSFYHGDEILTITHIALNRSIYAKGVIHAIDFLTKKSKGLYNMTDCILER